MDRALEILMQEIKADHTQQINVPSVLSNSVPSTSLIAQLSSSTNPHMILEWTQEQVHQWLIDHHLLQLSRLLHDYDGRSLIHLYKYMKRGQPSLIMSLLQEDSVRRLNESISLVELSRFQSLMHRQMHITEQSKNGEKTFEENKL